MQTVNQSRNINRQNFVKYVPCKQEKQCPSFARPFIQLSVIVFLLTSDENILYDFHKTNLKSLLKLRI